MGVHIKRSVVTIVINKLGIKSRFILKLILAMRQHLLVTIVCMQVAIFLNTANSGTIYQDKRLINPRINDIYNLEQTKYYFETNKLKDVLRYIFHENIQNSFKRNGEGINIKVRGYKLQQLMEKETERKKILAEINASDLPLFEKLERKWFNRVY